MRLIACALTVFYCFNIAYAEIKTLNLCQSEELAIANNERIVEVNNLVEKAKYGYYRSISDYLPQLNFYSYAYKSENDQILYGLGRDCFLTEFSVIQSILSTDKFYDIKISDLIVQDLKMIRKEVVNNVIYQVRAIYNKILLDKNNIKTALIHIETLKDLAMRLEDKLAIGTTTTFDVNQLQVAVSNASANYYKNMKLLKVDQDSYAKLLGYLPGTIKLETSEENIDLETIPLLNEKLSEQRNIFLDNPISNGLFFPKSNPQNQLDFFNTLFDKQEINKWNDIALKFRPDILKAKKKLEIAKKQINKARGKYLPDIAFNFNYGGNPSPPSFYPSDKFNNQHMEWAAGVVLGWNIFDSFKKEFNISAQKAGASAEKSNLNDQIQEAFKEVRDQIFSLESSIATNVSSEGNVMLAKQALIQSEQKLEIGTITIFDYQIALNNYIEALNINFQSLFDVVDSYYLLRHATGIDVEGKG